MWLLPRLRLAFARRPWLYWALVVVCGLVVWRQVSAAEDQASRAAHAWGLTRSVWVADTDTGGGDPVRASRHDYPRAMLPAVVLTALPDRPLAARQLRAGQVLTQDDVLSDRSIPVTWVVLAVPADHAPRLTTGTGASIFQRGQRICDGVAVASTADLVEVGMPADCAASVSADLAAVVLARRVGATPPGGIP